MKGEELTAENLRSTYLKVPLLNLTEAIKKTTSFVKYEKNCPTGVTSHTITPFGLTPDDLAAIKAYTSACGLYSDLNAALRTEKIEKIQPWFSYLKLFDTAINKIPPVKRRYCRGITVSPNSSYTVGTVITWWGVTSVSTEPSTCQSFGSSGTLYNINSVSARNITNYSAIPSEAESILLPGTKVKITKMEHDSMKDVHVIEVEEILSDSIDQRPQQDQHPQQDQRPQQQQDQRQQQDQQPQQDQPPQQDQRPQQQQDQHPQQDQRPQQDQPPQQD
ncbi:unnamed protein product [Adineta steineri]|uniref:NAD(P)(+)--arginine ADP-ribosyltransferase n=1 Tax=Adineta steineri TaxID=433720 RepID=A0A819KPN3_9BILA|nr:unnamed protein product [Adineta steineri]CAF3948773.1 unnamed protein product [Adineta steineri]CAF4143971.1 unnamed protein product [Adineta steineri]